MRYDVDSLENRDPKAVERCVSLVEPLLETFFSPVVRGLERIPSGSGLYVANHNGGVLFPEVYLLGATLFRHSPFEDLPYVLAHDLAVRPPVANQLLVPLGAVRATPENAHRLFDAGRKVVVYPGGDVEALRPFRDRDRISWGERRGYLRLALREGVPIIPVVSAGAHSGMMVLDDGGRIARFFGIDRKLRVKVFPIVLSVPWGLTIGFPPPYVPVPTRIFMEVLQPIRFARSGRAAAADDRYVEQCHRRVVAAMQDALTRLSHERAADKRVRQLRQLEKLASVLGLTRRERDHVEKAAVTVGMMPSIEQFLPDAPTLPAQHADTPVRENPVVRRSRRRSVDHHRGV